MSAAAIATTRAAAAAAARAIDDVAAQVGGTIRKSIRRTWNPATYLSMHRGRRWLVSQSVRALRRQTGRPTDRPNGLVLTVRVPISRRRQLLGSLPVVVGMRQAVGIAVMRRARSDLDHHRPPIIRNRSRSSSNERHRSKRGRVSVLLRAGGASGTAGKRKTT